MCHLVLPHIRKINHHCYVTHFLLEEVRASPLSCKNQCSVHSYSSHREWSVLLSCHFAGSKPSRSSQEMNGQQLGISLLTEFAPKYSFPSHYTIYILPFFFRLIHILVLQSRCGTISIIMTLDAGGDWKFEDILTHLGEFGPYQIRIFVLLTLMDLSISQCMLFYVYGNINPGWSCSKWNGTITEWVVNTTDKKNEWTETCAKDGLKCEEYKFHGSLQTIVSEVGILSLLFHSFQHFSYI